METEQTQFQKQEQYSADGFEPDQKSFALNKPDLMSEYCQNFRKLQPSLHLPCLIGTIVFYTTVIAVSCTIKTFQNPLASVYVIVLSYVFYLICCIPCGDFIFYITNMNSYGEYKRYHERLKKEPGYLKFGAQCYHYSNQYKLQRIVSETDSAFFPYVRAEDESGRIINTYQMKHYAFVHFKREYEFSTENVKRKILTEYSKFKIKNLKDSSQKFNCSLEFQGFQERIGVFSASSNRNCKIIFFITALGGFALFYALFMEILTFRYEITIKKKIQA